MKCIVSTGALLCALVLCASVSPAAAQIIPKNPKINISYVEPRNPKYKPIHERLTRLKALETLQQFLSPLKLPAAITLKVDECDGALAVPYKPEGPAIICYSTSR